ncbi:hypothetical protein D3C80_1301780 [compost metagenome]
MSTVLIPGRFVVCAAVKYGDVIIAGARHFDRVMHSQLDRMNEDKLIEADALGEYVEGFIDQFGVFMDRSEAYKVALAGGQLNTRRLKSGNQGSTELFSEDIY